MSSRRVVLWLALLLIPTAPVRAPSPPAASPRSASRVVWTANTQIADPVATASPEDPDGPWIQGESLVAPPDGTSLDELARSLGGEVVEPVGRSGYGVVRGADPGALAAAGAESSRLGRIVGAGKTSTSAAPRSWQLTRMGIPSTTADWSAWTVAVLDTGVAYENQGPYVEVPGLVGVSFVDPVDLVQNDGHPNDDHQHGTHVTSLIASRGAYPGVVPGVTILPIKVLDRTSTGTEWALVEGIYEAVDHGADVINLSLSFPLGYEPSPALEGALEYAWDSDVVLVAAAGNDGARELSWPAASRLVVSVGAETPKNSSTFETAPYSNTSPALDILAPGGSLAGDLDRDGWPDGILAETIDPSNPARVGYWFYEGTSQAAALVSGLAVRLLAAGVAPHDIGPTLQQSSGGYDAIDASLTGTGADSAYLPGALANRRTHQDLYAGLLPYVAGPWLPDPRARVTVLDGHGAAVRGAAVVGSMYSDDGVAWPMCTTGIDGTCDLRTFDLFDASSAWVFRVDAVVVGGVAQRPSRAIWQSDLAAAELAALRSQDDGHSALASYWPGGLDPSLGWTREAWAVGDLGTGLVSSPMGVLFLPNHVNGLATAGTMTLDLGGTGLVSSPVGTLTAKTLTFDGSGLVSSPVGTHTTLVGLSGSGLLSSPMGTSAVYSGPILLDRGTTIAGASAGPAFEWVVGPDQGGVRDDLGYTPSSDLLASGAVDVGQETSDAIAPSAAVPAIEWVH